MSTEGLTKTAFTKTTVGRSGWRVLGILFAISGLRTIREQFWLLPERSFFLGMQLTVSSVSISRVNGVRRSCHFDASLKVAHVAVSAFRCLA